MTIYLYSCEVADNTCTELVLIWANMQPFLFYICVSDT